MDLLYWQSLVQGIVEGITEFLPVSSTGHMILVDETALKMEPEEFAEMFEVVIQLGAILSVVVYFHKKVFDGIFRFDFKSPQWRLWFKVLPAVVPALVIGALYAKLHLQQYLFNSTVVAVMLILGGIALLIVDSPRFASKERNDDLEKLTCKRAIGIGLVQCIAMIPGTSRSAATIIGGMCFGCSRALAAEFSFFLAIPTMVAASGYSLMKGCSAMTAQQWMALGIGFVTAFFVAWAVIAGFMSFIKKHDFRLFAWYRIILGAVILLFFSLK